jgi:type IV fimbrial biogenesis protein FimT
MMKKLSGFTLLELMVAVAIVGVLATIAAPQFSQWIENNRLNNGSLSIRSALMLARSTAVEKNSDVVVTFNEAGGGFTVFVDDGDLTKEAGEEVIREGTMPIGITMYDTVVSGGSADGFTDGKASYNPMGFPGQAGTVSLKNAAATKVQRVILSAAGSVKIEAGS